MLNFRQKIIFCSLVLLLFGAVEASPQDSESQPQIAKNNAETKASVSSADSNDAENESKITVVSSTKKSAANYSRVGVQTDQTLPLTLSDAIRKALENNNEIEISRTDVQFQETQLRSLQGIYDPIFTVAPTYTRNNNTGSSATNDFRINTDLFHNIKPGGGNYQVFFNNTRTENSFTQAQLTSGSSFGGTGASGFYSSSLGVRYTQPLFRNFRIDNTRRQIKIQRKRLQQSDADFRRQTIDIISRVQRAYWDLVFALRDQQNRRDNLRLAEENLRQVEARIKAGASAPLASAEVQTEVANRESDLLIAIQQVSIAENTLKTLLLRDPNASEWSVSYVPTDKPVYSDEAVILDDAMKDALGNRPELQRLNLQRQINEIDLAYFRNQTKPQVDLVTSFSLNGNAQGGTASTTSQFVPLISGDPNTNASAYLLSQIRRFHNGLPFDSEIPLVEIPPTPTYLVGGFNRSFANIFRSDAVNYSVGVTFSFPLRNRTAEANLAGAKIQQEQINAQTRSQEQIVIAEVRNAVQALETARLRVLTSRRARENAEIQLEGERKLFEVGRSTTFLLFQRENALTNARNAEIRAETDYNKALSDLQKATSTTFRVNNIQIDSPMDEQD